MTTANLKNQQHEKPWGGRSYDGWGPFPEYVKEECARGNLSDAAATTVLPYDDVAAAATVAAILGPDPCSDKTPPPPWVPYAQREDYQQRLVRERLVFQVVQIVEELLDNHDTAKAEARSSTPVPKDKPFEISTKPTVYEAAMVYSGRHPYPKMFGLSEDVRPHDDDQMQQRCLTLLKTGLYNPHAQLSWDIFQTLAKMIERGEIDPINRVHDRDGQVNLFRTTITWSDLRRMTKDRSDQPEFLSKASRNDEIIRCLNSYVADKKKVGEPPTERGLIAAAKEESLDAGRNALRRAFKKRFPNLRKGRPIE